MRRPAVRSRSAPPPLRSPPQRLFTFRSVALRRSLVAPSAWALCAASSDGTVKRRIRFQGPGGNAWIFPIRASAESLAMGHHEPAIALSEPSADEIKTTTCYMCACRCGIRVFLKDGKVRYIEGNRDHPVNKGVLCGKGSAGIMQHYSPARLQAPLLRMGERGSGDFKEISWEEALGLATEWLGEVRRTDPKKLAFFTGRDQSQSLTGWWAMMYGTPNFAAHGG